MKRKLSERDAARLFSAWGPDAPERFRENPYAAHGLLWGLPWAKLDEIARDMGCAADDPRRLRSLAEVTLEDELRAGHCYMLTHTLLARIGATDPTVLDAEFAAAGNPVPADAGFVVEGKRVFLRRVIAAEVLVARLVARTLTSGAAQ